jgi:hypothetical protein
VALKERQFDTTTRAQFLSFQYDLAQALYNLSRAYDRVVAESKQTIARKERLDPSRFARRMAILARYAEALNDALRIGKSLGDSFAWLFYIREPTLIERHLQHSGNLHVPAGVGGQGEVEFMRHLPLFREHIVIYHGTTTFLRIGDVSFVHLPTATVSAIGELKTRRVDDRTAETELYLIGDKKLLPRRMAFPKKVPKAGEQRHVTLPPRKQAQLQRQMRAMSAALDADEPARRFSVAQMTSVTKLEIAVRRARLTKLTDVQIDDGLVAVVVRYARQGTKFSSRLLPYKIAKVAVEDAPRIAMKVADTSSNGNSLILNRLHVGFIPGMTPIFWAPVSAGTLKRLFFREVVVWTWFNPVHLVKKLHLAGYDVKANEQGVPTEVTASVGKRRATAQQVESFMLYIQQHLVPEASVVNMIDHIFAVFKNNNVPKNARVKVSLHHFYGAPPPPLPRKERRQSTSRLPKPAT